MKDPRVALTPEEYVRVEAQAAVEYPGECCGVVLVRGDADASSSAVFATRGSAWMPA